MENATLVSNMKRIAVFASGEGTNTQHLIDHFKDSGTEIALIVCNNPNANVLKRAKNNDIPSLLTDRNSFYNGDTVLKRLQRDKIDLIVCAGFLWKIPHNILQAFPDKIVNVHPALLPKFGGKGMYGLNVHKAVIGAGEKESGITIHYLNEHYDEGKIVLQKKCEVTSNETPESLAQKVHKLEHVWYPRTIEQLLNKKL
jgi:phosphoribosylglycinamide formyltransferase-1